MTDTDQLEELREEFAGHWHIWRSQRDGEPVSWMASLRTPAAGIEPTIMCGTAEQLREALINQRQLADRHAGWLS